MRQIAEWLNALGMSEDKHGPDAYSWHKVDMSTLLSNVGIRGRSGYFTRQPRLPLLTQR